MARALRGRPARRCKGVGAAPGAGVVGWAGASPSTQASRSAVRNRKTRPLRRIGLGKPAGAFLSPRAQWARVTLEKLVSWLAASKSSRAGWIACCGMTNSKKQSARSGHQKDGHCGRGSLVLTAPDGAGGGSETSGAWFGVWPAPAGYPFLSPSRVFHSLAAPHPWFPAPPRAASGGFRRWRFSWSCGCCPKAASSFPHLDSILSPSCAAAQPICP